MLKIIDFIQSFFMEAVQSIVEMKCFEPLSLHITSNIEVLEIKTNGFDRSYIQKKSN